MINNSIYKRAPLGAHMYGISRILVSIRGVHVVYLQVTCTCSVLQIKHHLSCSTYYVEVHLIIEIWTTQIKLTCVYIILSRTAKRL